MRLMQNLPLALRSARARAPPPRLASRGSSLRCRSHSDACRLSCPPRST